MAACETEPNWSAPAQDGLHIAIGTYEDAKRMEGYEQEIRYSEVPVSEAMIAFYCALIEDGNPSFWDSEFAGKCWGSLVAPPAMINIWTMPLPWRPQGADPRLAIGLSVPVPGRMLVNVRIEVEYFGHVKLGDRISSVERVDHVSPEKRTRLGLGHFIESSTHFRNQNHELLAIHRNTLFRYEPDLDQSS
jgi:uncharacterized protein